MRSAKGIRIVIGMVALVCGGSRSEAQQGSKLPPLEGRYVRLHTCSDSTAITGHVALQDSVAIGLSTGEAPRVQRSELRRVEIRGHDRGRWATIGIFAGAVLGGLVYNMTHDRSPGSYTGLVSLYIAAPIGGLIGGVAGAVAAPEEWVPIFRAPCD